MGGRSGADDQSGTGGRPGGRCSGDSNALAELYRAYYQPVFLLAASLTGDAALAEDTVQEVFLTVQTCAGRYRPGTNGRAWLFGVTRNVARWQLRRAHYDTMDEEEPDALPAGRLDGNRLPGDHARRRSAAGALRRRIPRGGSSRVRRPEAHRNRPVSGYSLWYRPLAVFGGEEKTQTVL